MHCSQRSQENRKLFSNYKIDVFIIILLTFN